MITTNQKALDFLKEKKIDLKKQIELTIKRGSRIILKRKSYEIVGVRNTRDRKYFIEILIPMGVTSESCWCENIRVASGSY